MMATQEFEIGQKVYHEGRHHRTKAGWMQANGQIVALHEDEDKEVEEVVVQYCEDDTQTYQVGDLEWTDILGGYWYVET